jgi:hypothetical protein
MSVPGTGELPMAFGVMAIREILTTIGTLHRGLTPF